MRHRFEVFRCLGVFLTAALLIGPVSPASAQSTAFTYQGSLSDRGTPETGFDDCRFRLFDATSSRAQIGTRSEIVADPYLAGTDAGWWEAVTADLTREEYSATPSSAGLQAPNRAHNLRTTFGERGIDVVPRTDDGNAPAWRFAWQTSALGRPGCMQAAAPASPQANGARVTYQHDGWSEWYENTPKGLEQGFTIERRPDEDGSLQIVGGVAGGLEPRASADGAIDFIDDHGACVIRYGELHVWDARGKDLLSHLVVRDLEVAIVIDDSGADYPLTIDPLLTSPSWTAEANLASALMGFSVSTAGDVNGDGFSDVIVGGWGYTNGQNAEGRAYVYHGSANGLSVTPNWTVEGNQANALFGYSVATAGDVNGDGFDDVIVGAFRHTNGQTGEGRAFVYHGSASGLSPTPNWTAESDQANAEFGSKVSTAGDVNEDGFADVIVGCPFFDNDQSDEGRVFVYHGSSSGLSLTANWSGEGDAIGVQFGASVSMAGDVNGDGFGDVIVGAWVYANGQANEGRAIVYHGSSSGLNATPNWTAEGNQANSYFGVSAAGAGDVNGDGYGDVIVGAEGYSNGQSSEGKVFAYHGSAGGLAASPSWTEEIDLADASFGHSVATAGDVNGDGYADVIVGAMNFTNGQFTEGQAIVYVGSRLGLQALPYWTAESNQASANFAISVGTAGDVNGDGFSDVIVGAWLYDNGQPDEGRAFVYHGSAGGLMILQQWVVNGEQLGARLGSSVATAGDVNGDGYSDVIVGAPAYDNGQSSEGRAFVYHGSATGLSFTANWMAESDQENASFGASVATAGDVNGDGFSDVIVGSQGFDGGQEDEGRAYVYHGSPAGLSLTPSWIAESDQALSYFGISVATAGDVNGDGVSDVIVGASGRVFNPDSGSAFVYHGSATGLATSPAWTAKGNQSESFFGYSVSTAGDVNGDGYSDVIVGAPQDDNGQFDEGRAFVYHGSPTGLGIANWTSESDQIVAFLGGSVSTAGDVNADGFSDVIVGAPGYSGGLEREGRVFVYHGSPTGLGIPTWTVEINQEDARLGQSVAAAGDVNGDGYGDVIVGAPRYDGALLDVGQALVYQGSSIGLSSAAAWIISLNQAFAYTGTSVGTAGDINGDGFSDVIVGVPYYEDGEDGEGSAIAVFGNERRGLDRVPRQTRTDGSAPISLLGASDSPTAFRLQALGRFAGGRGDVRLQYEVKPFGTPFNGSALVSGDAFDTGAPSAGTGSAVPLSELAGGLTPKTLYHWRLRLVSDSPFFPRSAWLTLAANGASEADLRTAAAATSVAGAPSEIGARWLEPAVPTPFTTATRLAYTLPGRGRARLAVYDVSGREVRVITNEVQPSGRYETTWDGRTESGRSVPTGVYLARLEFDGRVEARKVVVAR